MELKKIRKTIVSLSFMTSVAVVAIGQTACTPKTPEAEKPGETQKQSSNQLSAQEASEIAEQAYLYLYPMVANYNSIYDLSINEKSEQYKGPMNQISNVARLSGPEDTAVVTPNSDTPYSFLNMDLRSEPLVVSLPEVESDRYYSLQLVDLYTHNVDYIGTRRDGNKGGNFLIAGPNWNGEVPKGIKRVIKIETDFMFAQFRTQLKGSDDLDNVKKIQSQYKVQPLSTFLGTKAPPAAPKVDWPAISREDIATRTDEFGNFLLQFAPVDPSEVELRKRFELIGIKAGAAWPPKLSPEIMQAIKTGQEKALKEIKDGAKATTSSLGLFGSREDMQGRYLQRAIGAEVGLYGNTASEALYPVYATDSTGGPLDTSKMNYKVTFPKGQLPPVSAFWSLTMYDGKTRFLVDNPIDRYLLNSGMQKDFKFNPDGSVTFYIQHKSPGAELESNWLPAPNGPAWLVLRLYLPKPEALNGKWTPPKMEQNK